MKLKQKLKNVLRTALSGTLAVSTFGAAAVIANAASYPDGVEEISSSNSIPNSDYQISFDYSKMDIIWGSDYTSTGKVTNDGSDNYYVSIPLQSVSSGYTYTDIVTFDQDNIAVIDGKDVDVEVSITQLDLGGAN